jgi:trehalose-phosphatase
MTTDPPIEGLPSALERWPDLAKRIDGKEIALFLDCDGTLAPIVARPEDAALPESMRRVLRALGDLCPTAIVSGRGRADVAALVELPNLYYVGSHGFDIAGPGGVIRQASPEIREPIERAYRELVRLASVVEGAIVEDKRFSISVHYRLVAPGEVPRLESMVDAVLAAEPRLRKGLGKMVLELRPRVDWDKGRAILWLLDAWRLPADRVVPIFVGDDLTDEDAFTALRGFGIGILVSEVPRATAAELSLRDPSEVRELLERLLRLRGNRADGN